MNPFDSSVQAKLEAFQRNERTEAILYHWLAARETHPANREVFERLAADEWRHYEEWQRMTGREVPPHRWKVAVFPWLVRLFGFTFAIKLMESGETDTGAAYRELAHVIPDVERIAREEDEHERALMAMLDEERLRYVGSIVLGLNDALVELTGALAGLTLALRQTRLIAMTGAITGLAAAMSMAASEYLSVKTEGGGLSSWKSAVYTGITYLGTVLLLITPYLVFANPYAALMGSLTLAVGIIAAFNYYLAVAREQPFGPRFFEMTLLSLTVSVISFGLGWAVRTLFGVEI